jgi:hypothetical protein
MWGKLTQQTVQRASRTTSHASARDDSSPLDVFLLRSDMV